MRDDSQPFINRELSWLEFNQRVLDEAEEASVPLLNRLHFLSITASNMDEFYMVRVGGLEMLVDQRIRKRDVAGMTPAQQLAAIALERHESKFVNDKQRHDTAFRGAE